MLSFQQELALRKSSASKSNVTQCRAESLKTRWISYTISPSSPPLQRNGGQSETLLNTCIAHSNSADLLLFNNASGWLS